MTDLVTAAPVDPRHLDRLNAELAQRAIVSGVVDVRHRVVDSPLGPLLVAASLRGVVRVAFEREGHQAVLDELARRLGPRVLRAGPTLDPVARELDAYFAGHLDVFSVPVDLVLARGFRRQVLDHLMRIPYGDTEAYADVARACGSPRAVRAAGTACATNPVPVLVPCHRVVRRDGTTGAYRGGEQAKRWLLALERRGPGADRHTAQEGPR